MPNKIIKLIGKQIGGKSKNRKKKKNIFLTRKRLFKKYKIGGAGEKKTISDVYQLNSKIYIVDEISDQNKRFEINQTVKQLLLPSQMGDTFKFMLLSKDCMIKESFMEARDFRYLL